MITIEQFNDYLEKLENHDWYYHYSDDGRVWRAGKARRAELRALADSENVYNLMYQACHDLHFRDNATEPGSYERARAVYVERIAELRQQIVNPDRYCITEANGECVSTDPRCMHNQAA